MWVDDLKTSWRSHRGMTVLTVLSFPYSAHSSVQCAHASFVLFFLVFKVVRALGLQNFKGERVPGERGRENLDDDEEVPAIAIILERQEQPKPQPELQQATLRHSHSTSLSRTPSHIIVFCFRSLGKGLSTKGKFTPHLTVDKQNLWSSFAFALVFLCLCFGPWSEEGN